MVEQPALPGLPAARRRRRPSAGPVPVAEVLPVARVVVDLAPAHLDRAFEYAVPAALDDVAGPGVRVRVRFGGQDVDGFLLERVGEAEHAGELAPLRRVVSAEPVLTPEVLRLARAVADRYAGTLPDVLRLAVPARHARTEGEVPDEDGPTADGPGDPAPTAGPLPPLPPLPAWEAYRGGPAFCRHVHAGGAPRAVWTALPGGPGEDWPSAVAQAVAACRAGGRTALVVVPDARDVDRVLAALDHERPDAAGDVVRLVADDGPAARYRAFLAARRGRAGVVVGTRASAFAPLPDLGLAVVWDDGDGLHAEPRAPYPHVREVLALRSELEGAALLVGSMGRSVEAQALVAAGWAHEVAADRPTVRRRTPRVQALTSAELAREGPAAAARLPTPAWRTLRDALARGPVLVGVPRAGYVPAVACARCRALARCTACHGPLGLDGPDGTPACRWCGRLATDWRCGTCGHDVLRSVRVGSERTAEELGRAFPGVPVRVSGARSAGGVLARVPDRPALVVSTPGAEPVADGGYAAAVLLDAAVLTSWPGLRSAEEAVRRWLSAAALVRPASAGGVVQLVGDAAERPTQALVRWDPAGLAARELDERSALALPPAVRTALVEGSRDAVAAVLARLALPASAEVLGPVPVTPAEDRHPDVRAGGASATAAGGLLDDWVDGSVRALVRVPRGDGPALTRTVAASLAVRSARRESGTVRVQVDAAEVL
ncbi:primosomal protein N' [Cellulomonas marina]|uniref:primosomal protein N' n=1 Tax=Cellulomonas marina TaxID=988821 RepID=UPI000B7CE71C|nr:primosomal protein N' [Cellulomonas marina]